jgi:hypothetical protein
MDERMWEDRKADRRTFCREGGCAVLGLISLLLADLDLARSIEGAEARLCASIAERALLDDPASRPFVESLAGGIASYAGPGSPINKVVGIGLDEDLDPATLDRVEKAFFERGSTTQAEVSILAQPAVHALLTRRGYVLQGFENVLARALTDDDSQATLPPGIIVQRIEAHEVSCLVSTMIAGFVHPDESGTGSGVALPPPAAVEHAMVMVAKTPGFRGYLARLEDNIAGGAGLRIDGAIAQLCGAATLPEFRRRGVQTALLAGRMSEARRAGCQLAILTAQPGSKSHFNAQRRGFTLVYTRALLVKEPKGN